MTELRRVLFRSVQWKTKKMRGITQPPFLLTLDVNKEGQPAKITYCDAPDVQDSIIEDIIQCLIQSNNTPTAARTFATTLLPKYQERYKDASKLKEYIANTLKIYGRQANPRGVCSIASTGGRNHPSLYTLSTEEAKRVNQGASNPVDSTGTETGRNEASDLAGESTETSSGSD